MTLTIMGPPRTKKNHQRIGRVNGRPVIFQSRSSEGWEADAIWQLKQQSSGWIAKAVPVSLCALVYRDRKVGDLGNYLAAICDALEHAGIVENDKWIQSFDGSRLLVDKNRPRVEIELLLMEEP